MIEQRDVVRSLWAKNMDAAKDIHKEMLPIWATTFMTTKQTTPYAMNYTLNSYWTR
jgi:hypothetical protein